MAGLGASGFVEKSASELVDEIADAQRASAALGASWVTSAESPQGQLNAIMADRFAELWEAIGLVYRSRDPRAASFAGLDAVCGLTGTTRSAATKGTVTLTLSVAAGRTIPAGSIAYVAGQTTNRWVTLAAAVNGSGSTANVAVEAEAETAGVYVANATTITGIATPQTGWLTVNNVADAVTGSAAESDPVLRARRDRELFAGGSSPIDSLRAALARVSGVSVAEVAENDSNATVDGMPPHSIEAIVQGGTDVAVARAIWEAKAGGIELHSSATTPTVEVVIDAGGFNRTITFTRPTNVDAYAEVIVILDSDFYPGDATLQDAIANVTAGQRAGQTLRKSDLIVAARAIAGVVDCTGIRLGRTYAARADTNLIASPREVLKLASARVTITVGYA